METDNWKIVTEIFHENSIQMEPNRHGYVLAKWCITVGMDMSKTKICHANEIYEIVATKMNTGILNVEKCVRTFVAKAWQDFPKWFATKPTNTTFLFKLIEMANYKKLSNNKGLMNLCHNCSYKKNPKHELKLFDTTRPIYNEDTI